MKPVEGRNYLKCGYCHSFIFPTELEDSADRITPLHERGNIDCPVCGEHLVAGAFDNKRIAYCERCRGVLIPNEVFGQVVRDRRRRYKGSDESPVPIDPRQYDRRLDCPRCNRKLEVHPYHGPGSVVIDSCASCHLIWLDHGEIAAIERAPGQRVPATSTYQPSIHPIAEQSPQDRHIDLLELFFS